MDLKMPIVNHLGFSSFDKFSLYTVQDADVNLLLSDETWFNKWNI